MWQVLMVSREIWIGEAHDFQIKYYCLQMMYYKITVFGNKLS